MKFNSQICTSVEQSKRLLELGLNEETADCALHYDFVGMDGEVYYLAYQIGHKCSGIPAWSLHRLMELIPGDSRESYLSLSKEDVGYSTNAYEWTFYRGGNIYDCMIDCIEWLIKQGGIAQGYLEEQK